jgi:hypothetical protein
MHFAFPVLFIALLVLTPFALFTLLSQFFLPTMILIAAASVTILLTKSNRVLFFLFIHSQIVLFIGMLHVISGRHKFIKQVKGTRKIGAQQYTAK